MDLPGIFVKEMKWVDKLVLLLPMHNANLVNNKLIRLLVYFTTSAITPINNVNLFSANISFRQTPAPQTADAIGVMKIMFAVSSAPRLLKNIFAMPSTTNATGIVQLINAKAV